MDPVAKISVGGNNNSGTVEAKRDAQTATLSIGEHKVEVSVALVTPPALPPSYVSAKQLSREWNIPTAKVMTWARGESLRCTSIGAERFFKRSDVDAALERGAKPLTRRTRLVSLAELDAQRRRNQAAASGVALVAGGRK